MPDAVVATVGLATSPGHAAIDTLVIAFGSSRVLLVLDNCEHLVQSCAELVDHLMRSCPQLRVLVTSREPLGVPGEVVWQVAPLAIPDDAAPSVEHLLQIDSIRLFVERAQAAQSGFSLTEVNATAVAQICRGLDGLPLALNSPRRP